MRSIYQSKKSTATVTIRDEFLFLVGVGRKLSSSPLNRVGVAAVECSGELYSPKAISSKLTRW